MRATSGDGRNAVSSRVSPRRRVAALLGTRTRNPGDFAEDAHSAVRQMEHDGIVRRIVHHQVPPKVEYALTEWGQSLCPALDALLNWAALKPMEDKDA
jgi:hypothetical protein